MSSVLARTLSTLALGALLTSGLVGDGWVGTAQAACPASSYPPAVCAPLAVTDSTLQDGQPFAAAARGFEEASSVAFYVHSTPRYLTTVRADAAGEASAHLVMPDDLAPGPHELLAIGTGVDGQPRTINMPITVLPGRYVAPVVLASQPPLVAAHAKPATGPLPHLTPATGSLPTTGLALGGYLLAAGACLVVGAAALRAGRSRLRRSAATGD